MLLNDKVALITGAGSGIGRATAELFSREGARVVVADIVEARGRDVAEGIVGASGDAAFVKADVGVMDEVRAMVEFAFERYGRIDVLYSNAGFTSQGRAEEIDEAEWDRTLDVCLKATWMIAHCAAPRMLADGGGAIVVTGSVHSIRGYASHVAYQASKGGVLALTRAMAADYAPTIRVNAILPGAVETGISGPIAPERREQIARMCALNRYGQPEDIAQVALFLASDMSSYMTGAHIVVDGGLTSIMRLPEGARAEDR